MIFSVTDRFVSLPERTLHAFCHALPEPLARHGGDAVGGFRAVAGSPARSAAPTTSAAASTPPRRFARSPEAVAAAPVFLPYLSGERTPHNDADATGLFAGLRADHGAEALIYAVLEGVAFAFADGVDVLAAAGARPAPPMLVGGGARSGFWGQMIADVTGLTIDLAAGAEAGAALGAARLAMLAAGAGDERRRLPPPADPAPIRPRRGERGAARPAPEAFPRALRRGKSGALAVQIRR